jgi:hypothetical protein
MGPEDRTTALHHMEKCHQALHIAWQLSNETAQAVIKVALKELTKAMEALA